MAGPIVLLPQLGRYRILQVLGSGGMGSVYLAEDTLLARKVALKVPHFTAEDSPVVLERFLREARTAAAIQHPNLCPIHDCGEVNGTLYLVMPLIEGKPLSRQVRKDNVWSPTEAVALVKKLALALEALHERGLIHRDLKPENVMIGPGGEPVVMDFGLARSVTNHGQQLTQTGALLGTPAYMSPEQVLGDPRVMGPATDVYSLGVMLYEMLAGRRPFEGPPALIFEQILNVLPDPPSARRRDLDPRLDRICLKALAKKPGERYGSMLAFAAALEGYLGQDVSTLVTGAPPAFSQTGTPSSASWPPHASPVEGLDTQALQPTTDTTVSTAPDRRRKRVLSLIGGVLGVALLIVVVWHWPSGTSKNDPVPEVDPSKGSSANSIEMKLVRVPAGKFLMGSPMEEKQRLQDETQHEVEITRTFFLGMHEVTQGQYERVMGTNPSYCSAQGQASNQVKGIDTRRFPVENVSWEDAVKFCEKLSASPEEKQAGRSYRLPTEAEWEYACRGGAAPGKPFHAGDSLSSSQANFNGNFPYGGAPKGEYRKHPCDVGSYPANDLGLHDMHGNVWEWCQDSDGPYDKTMRKDPNGPASNKDGHRVIRGGAWGDNSSGCRSAARGRYFFSGRNGNIGFRVVCVVRNP